MVPQEKRRSSGEKPIRNCRQGAAAGSIDVEPDLLNWEIETNTKQNKTGPPKKRSLKKTAFKFQFAISLSLATPWWILIYMKLDQTFTKYVSNMMKQRSLGLLCPSSLLRPHCRGVFLELKVEDTMLQYVAMTTKLTHGP